MHDPTLTEPSSGPPRRGFLKQFVTGLITAVVGLVPGLAGLLVLLDPLRRRSSGPGEPLLVARFGSLPADGVPRRFRVMADRTDAWNTYRNVPIGAVFLRRTSEDKVTAFNAACPHAGCSVGYSSDRKAYLCPCHDSAFTVEGQLATARSPSPRGLDPLEVEVRNGDEIWVKFQNFQAGHKERHPVS